MTIHIVKILNGHELAQTPGDDERQGSLACYSLWYCRVGHDFVTEQQKITRGWNIHL